MIKQVRYPHIKEVSKEELVKFQLEFTLDGYRLNNSDLNVLSYVYVHGKDAIDKLLDSRLFKSEKSIENIISKYRKKGLIQKGRFKLHSQIKPYIQDIEYTIQLKIND